MMTVKRISAGKLWNKSRGSSFNHVILHAVLQHRPAGDSKLTCHCVHKRAAVHVITVIVQHGCFMAFLVMWCFKVTLFCCICASGVVRFSFRSCNSIRQRCWSKPTLRWFPGPDHPWGWWGGSLKARASTGARTARYNTNLQCRTTLDPEISTQKICGLLEFLLSDISIHPAVSARSPRN